MNVRREEREDGGKKRERERGREMGGGGEKSWRESDTKIERP